MEKNFDNPTEFSNTRTTTTKNQGLDIFVSSGETSQPIASFLGTGDELWEIW